MPSFIAVAFCLCSLSSRLFIGYILDRVHIPLIFIGYKIGVIANSGHIEQSCDWPSSMHFIKKECGCRVSQGSSALRPSSRANTDGSSQ